MAGEGWVWSTGEWLENLDEQTEDNRTSASEDQDTELLQSQVRTCGFLSETHFWAV